MDVVIVFLARSISPKKHVTCSSLRSLLVQLSALWLDAVGRLF